MISEERVIPSVFYDDNTVNVARNMLGTYLVRKLNDQWVVGKIVETEAYLDSGDLAAHNIRGITKRTEVLYGASGFTYVHSLRQYFCLDIVTEGIGRPASVLIRALEPVEGIALMKHFRKTEDLFSLTNGPGKLCQALQITHEQNAVNVTSYHSSLFILDAEQAIGSECIDQSCRIGISKAIDFPLRFSLKDNPFVSILPKRHLTEKAIPR
jgi:DNA-3-methyladenine glycosylase